MYEREACYNHLLTSPGKGARRMGIALRLNMKQILLVLFFLLILFVTAMIVIHAATPNVFHVIAFSPKVIHRH